MWRTVLVGLSLCVGAWVLVNALVTTDVERVEQEVERLLGLARTGGDEAAGQILAALADDYSGSISRRVLERNLERHVAGGRIESLTTGDYKAVWKGDEIVVPILFIQARSSGLEARFVLTVAFGERDGAWKVTRVSRWRR